MDCLRIKGGARLHGTIVCSGSKNASLPIMAATILTTGPTVLTGVPDLLDVNTLSLLLGHLGLEVKRDAGGDLHLNTVDVRPTTAEYELVRRMRASFCVLGPLLARRGKAVVSLPGGCNIGTRPVDLHLSGLHALGADLRIERGYVIAEAARLCGAKIDLRGPHGSTVTGTANVMSAATLAEGVTIITGAATEPEIVDLGRYLNAAGAQITGLGTDTLTINGVEQLHGVLHEVIPDRIEAATLLIAAAITQGTVSVVGAQAEHLGSVLDALTSVGVDVARGHNKITVHAGNRPRSAQWIARPYPGLPTDLQAQLMSLLALADGTSHIADDVFPDRHMHIGELNRLGARIERRGKLAIIEGVRRFCGAEVMATDLRASAALVLAGLAATHETKLHGVEHLDRGYERLDSKLAMLGGQIEREGALADVAAAQISEPSHLAGASRRFVRTRVSADRLLKGLPSGVGG